MGRREDWAEAIEAPRKRQGRAGEYFPETLREAGNQPSYPLLARLFPLGTAEPSNSQSEPSP